MKNFPELQFLRDILKENDPKNEYRVPNASQSLSNGATTYSAPSLSCSLYFSFSVSKYQKWAHKMNPVTLTQFKLF